MEKITLAGKEYVLPELNFGAMRKLSKLGFKFNDIEEMQENTFEFCSLMVAYITGVTVDEADTIIDESFSSGEEFVQLVKTLSNWFATSDFFKKMQAKHE